MIVEERFSNGKTWKNVETVGELIQELQRLPSDTPVRQGMEDSTDIVLFNALDDAHVSFDEGLFWDEEDE